MLISKVELHPEIGAMTYWIEGHPDFKWAMCKINHDWRNNVEGLISYWESTK